MHLGYATNMALHGKWSLYFASGEDSRSTGGLARSFGVDLMHLMTTQQ